jgi:L-lactate dehydrogenase complex protein LldG
MEETTSREKVLKKIRSALLDKNENPYPSLDTESDIYQDSNEEMDITFAKAFTLAGGKFIYCENEADFKSNMESLIAENHWNTIYCFDPEIDKMLPKNEIQISSDESAVENATTGITSCEFLIARLGSIMVTSNQTSGRRLNILPDTHLVVGKISQIVPDIKDALNLVREKYSQRLPSMISFITGPSRTADIEKTLVMGAHGPKELYLFLIDEE